MRFHWIYPSEAENYPLPNDSDFFLWDEQEQCAVLSVDGRYVNLVCLEHRDYGMPFTDLETWLNSLSNDELENAGVETTKGE